MTLQAAHRRTEPVRILHAVDSLASGGTELASAALIERTADRFDHFVCCFRGSGPAENAAVSGHRDLSRQAPRS